MSLITEKVAEIKSKNECLNLRIEVNIFPDYKNYILFLFSNWNKGTHLLLEKLVLCIQDKYRNAKLVIWDIDLMNDALYNKFKIQTSNGYGETYWIKDGEILHCIKKYDTKNFAFIQEYNDSLFEKE